MKSFFFISVALHMSLLACKEMFSTESRLVLQDPLPYIEYQMPSYLLVISINQKAKYRILTTSMSFCIEYKELFLLAQQPCVGLGLLCGFVIVNF
jgi:hypothetical protein